MREEHDIFHADFVDEEIEQAESQQPEYQQPIEHFPDHSTDERAHIVHMLRAITQQESQSTMNELDAAWQRIVTSRQYATTVQSEQADDTIKHAVPAWNAQSTVMQREKTSRTIETMPSMKQRSRRTFSILAAVACIALVVGSMLWIENKMQTSRVAGDQHDGKTTATATATPSLPKLTYTYTQTGDSYISSISWSPTGNRLLSVGTTIRTWDFTQTFLALNPAHSSSTHTVWSPDGTSIATNNSNTGIEIRDAATGQLQHTCAAPTSTAPQGLPGADIQPKQPSLLSAQIPYTSRFADSTGGYFNLAWSPDGKYLAATFYAPGANSFTYPFVGLVVYATADCSIAWHPTTTNGWDDLIEWSPDSKYLALSKDMGQSADIVNFATKHKVYTYDASDITAFSWSPDGKRIALYHSNGYVSVSDALTGAHSFVYKETSNTGYISNVAWSPDSKYIISTSNTIVGSTTQIWNTTTGQVIHTFASKLSTFAVAWSPDGDYIAIAYGSVAGSSAPKDQKDATVAVWHIPHW